ncbi:hypothetical protein PHLGIDRAFT_15771 [Phlebiopsis gigantea 11061_1 CR5-6]|uniref:Fungal-type protein kinase domain-containing protein n=1 Tax=Phlebiopsis gigantea (strain 11061_1 CR5-6) TaxID=745531 RepID=A0A0C3S231_PHLG1|nr:hypothetical protein PHLGIDRAFT_15771 [Phlebiopsis gigantea 11061_1 CR5-6]
MSPEWALLGDVGSWLDVCLPGEKIAQDILARVGDFSEISNNIVKGELKGQCLAKIPRWTTNSDVGNVETSAEATGHNTSQSELGTGREATTRVEDAESYVDERDNPASGRPHHGRAAWAWITTIIEVKSDPGFLPYDVAKDGSLALPNTTRGRKARAEIMEHIGEICLHQHRQFVLTAVIVQRRAFLMRWDRTGAIVAKPFDFIDEPEKLLTFLYRIAVAERSAQGYDPTATLASPEEIERFKAYHDFVSQKAGTPTVLLEFMSDIFSPERLWLYPIYKLICPDSEHSTAARPGAPRHGTRSPTGRGGKDFVAYDLDNATERCVFLKDYWYALGDSVHPETEVYQKLNASGVRFVATLVAGGDVGPSSALQETLTQTYLPEEGRPCVRRHHRFVVEEIGRPLETYGRDTDLYATVFDALIVHKDAWEKAHVLHRDASMGNILINVETDMGFLNDWDLCKYKDELNKFTSQHARSVIWPYMSATLCSFPRKPNELADDLESFVHVISLALLRFHENTLTFNFSIHREPLGSHMGLVYDPAHKTGDGYWVGSFLKMSSVRNGWPGFGLVDRTSNLSVLLKALWYLGKNHYSGLDLDAMNARWGAQDGHIVEADADTLARPADRRTMVVKGFPAPRKKFPPPDPLILNQPSSRVRQPELGDFTSHDTMYEIFLALRDGWDEDGYDTKTEDNFIGMTTYGIIRPP